MVIDEFKYLYWDSILQKEIESKYRYLIETIMEFNKHRRNSNPYRSCFDEYLFAKKDNKQLFGITKPHEFISKYELSSELVLPQPDTDTIIQGGIHENN